MKKLKKLEKLKKSEILENDDGQALVEFFLFLPFILMMYTVTLSIGNAINASINQQKIARSYFFYRNQNDSTLPRPQRTGGDPYASLQIVGMSIIGWAEELENEVPVATCFRFRVPLGQSAGDSCRTTYSGGSTQYIRVGTVFGICGATYAQGRDSFVRLPGDHQNSDIAYIGQGCHLQ